MSRSVVPDILSRLEPLLEDKVRAWEANGRATPSLPYTSDGKVNVRGLVKLLGLPVQQEQHFFKKAEIRSVVNAVAQEQGLKPIGARGDQDDVDAVVGNRMKLEARRHSELGKLVAEQAATIEWQRREIASLREQLRIVEETGQTVRLGGVL
ncbi:hypothetical protein DevBK_07295 [Devosia sp. BK]|uniref:hypothetical protein n=1 Tax=Devosia sp. BK TaxID=2871706 RepID=UPI00293A5D40|nr:hypothetical protein [Devosia sp. BK]MDV3251128.1 hypothetical protein [Devosia sp. BK]